MIIVVGTYFLKGQELWKSRYIYYSKFTNTEGLTTGRPVNLNGLKVGIITNVTFDPKNFNSIIVEFELSNPNIKKLRKGTTILLNSDLLSGAYLDISWRFFEFF